MENDKIKNIKEHILKEAENVIKSYANENEKILDFDLEYDYLEKKLKIQRIISISLFILLIIVAILK